MVKTSRGNLHPRATMSSSTSVGQHHRRDEGVDAPEQQSVAAAAPHGKEGESLTLNFTPHRPLRVPACAPTALVAAAPASLNGA